MKSKMIISLLFISLLMVGCVKDDTSPNVKNKKNEIKNNNKQKNKQTEEKAPIEAENLTQYLSLNGIEIPKSLIDGQEIVKTKELRELICQWIESYENSNLNTNGFNEKYKNNLSSEDLILANSEIISLNNYKFKDVPLETALEMSISLRAYFDGSIYGNYKEISTGIDLVEYYSVLYSYYLKYGKSTESLISPQELLSFLDIDETTAIDRKIFSKLVVSIIESVTGRELNLDEYKPEFELHDGDDDNLKRLHMINFYKAGRILFIHPEHKLNKYELKADISKLLNYTAREFTEEEFKRIYIDSTEMLSLLNDIYLENKDKELAEKNELIIDNTREYSFYVTQNDQSQYSSINCVPASTAIITKWYDENLDFTSEQVRNSNLKGGRMWSMDETMKWLDDYNIPYKKNVNNDIAILKNELDDGAIVQLAIDNGYQIHVVVVVGYRQVGEDIYYMVYDPANEQSYQGRNIDHMYVYESNLDLMMSVKGLPMIIVK